MTPPLTEIAKLIRYYILKSTSQAASGHPTSSLSATDLMTAVFFQYLRFDLENPKAPNNDRLIFSKGHAAPLLYALYGASGKLSLEDLLHLREIDSPLEGHPTPRFPLVEVSTGSLGQGLSVGVGMALNAKYLDKLPYRTFVLMGDGEIAEGSIWEAANLASHYKLDNLIGIVDVNKLGQSQATMLEYDLEAYQNRFQAFGWSTFVVDGHSFSEIQKALDQCVSQKNNQPKVIIAKTKKGSGISFLEGQDNWHGKAVGMKELEAALKELGPIDLNLKVLPQKPEKLNPQENPAESEVSRPKYSLGQEVQTRKAYGEALAFLVTQNPEIIALDADTKNSTFSEDVLKKHPHHFFEMFIAEQNMMGVALGLSKRGKQVFASSFAAFLTRAFDQLRMSSVSQADFKVVGSHAGVSIGEDGPSQMGLEDLAMFRAICGSTVLYPGDGVATQKLLELSLKQKGIVYFRTSRPATPILYGENETFTIGGSKTLRSSDKDEVTLVAAGITLIESLKAYDILDKKGVKVRVIDCYSVKPIDGVTLKKANQETKALMVIEDHWIDGGLGDAVLSALAEEKKTAPIFKLAVTKMSRSGKKDELMDLAGISAKAIVKKVEEILG